MIPLSRPITIDIRWINLDITTLKFPVWKYHLTNLNNDAVEDFDVDYSRLSIEKAYIDMPDTIQKLIKMVL